MMIIKIIFVIVTWLPAFLIACPTIIDGWTFQFKPDVDTVIQGKFLNSQFPAFFYFKIYLLKHGKKILIYNIMIYYSKMARIASAIFVPDSFCGTL